MFAKLVKPVFSDLLCRLRSCRPRSALGSLRRSTCSSSRAERHYLRRMNSEMKRPVADVNISKNNRSLPSMARLWWWWWWYGKGKAGVCETLKLTPFWKPIKILGYCVESVDRLELLRALQKINFGRRLLDWTRPANSRTRYCRDILELLEANPNQRTHNVMHGWSPVWLVLDSEALLHPNNRI